MRAHWSASYEAAKKAGIELVLLVTPTTPEARMAKIAAASEGFVYLVSLAGVTGQLGYAYEECDVRAFAASRRSSGSGNGRRRRRSSK